MSRLAEHANFFVCFFSRLKFLWATWLVHTSCCLPEKTLAAFTGHGVEVEARGLVTAHAADPRHVPIKLIGGQGGGTYDGGLHHWTRKDTWKRELSDHSMQKDKKESGLRH